MSLLLPVRAALIAAAALCASLSAAGQYGTPPASTIQTGTAQSGTAQSSPAQSSGGAASPGARADRDAEQTAARHAADAANVVRTMSADPGLAALLKTAKGVFIVPTYARAAVGIGASGGSGVLVVRQAGGTWSDPAFYTVGGLSLGAQIGVEGGSIALVLNNEKALDNFRRKNNFSLNADAGLTVVNWARTARAQLGKADVVAWSGTKGLFGNVATVALNDVHFNQHLTTTFYKQPMTVQEILERKPSHPQADALRQALAASTSAG